MSKIKNFISRFGFNTTPFTCEIRVEEQFKLDLFQQSLTHLERTVNKRMSGALIAPSGTGKTSLLRALSARLPENRFRISYIKVTDISKRDLCREIATATSAEPAGNYPTLVRRLQERFSNGIDIDGIRPVLILDEAHDIRPEVLGVLRILTNFDMDSRLVVSIIMAGQLRLSKLLNHPKLEDISQRLSIRSVLRLLSRTELTQYIQHRCQIAGVSSSPFDSEAMEAIFEVVRGNMRATDHLALKSLEVAHDADCNVVDSNHIIEARRLLWG